MAANDSSPPNEIASETSPLQELSWFPAIIFSILIALAIVAGGSAWTPPNVVLNSLLFAGSIPYVRILCVAYGCLIGYGGQQVRRPIALLYIPSLIFSVAIVCDVLNEIYSSGTLVLLLLYVGPLGLISERSRENPLVGAFVMDCSTVVAAILLVAVFTPYFIYLVLFFFFPIFAAVLPTLVGCGCGWFLRQLTETRTSRRTPRTVRRIVPRQFSIMSLFALTTAVAIGTWTAMQVKLPPASWLGIIFWTLMGNAVAIVVVRYCSDPILPTYSLDDLRHTHDPLSRMIYCPNCRQTSRRETCFCPHCKVVYGGNDEC